jgi:hypothetical protein
MVPGAVSLIESIQPAAGECFAFKAEPDESFPEQITPLFQEGTVLAARQAAGAV